MLHHAPGAKQVRSPNTCTHPAHIRPSTLPDAKVLSSKSCNKSCRTQPKQACAPLLLLSKPRLAPVHTAEAVRAWSATHKQSLRPDLEKACPRCRKDCMSCAHSTGLSAAREPAGTQDRQLRVCMAWSKPPLHFGATRQPLNSTVETYCCYTHINPQVQDIPALQYSSIQVASRMQCHHHPSINSSQPATCVQPKATAKIRPTSLRLDLVKG